MSNLSEDILANIDIVDIIGKYVNLKKAGKNYLWLCPFHKEKTPSFTVAPDKQIYKCFWCWVGWNAIKFLMEIERIDYPEAIKILSKQANIDLAKYNYSDSKDQKLVWQKEKSKLINKKVLEFFQENLKKSNISQIYLHENRNLTDKIIKEFEIWYAPDSNYELIKTLKNYWFSEEDIINLWIWRKGSTWDLYSFFRNRIMFPIYDHMSNIIAFAGRAIKTDDMPKYINTTETVLYDKSKVLYWLNIAKNHIKDFDKIIFVEWYMDVIAFHRAWIPIAVASCGTSLTPWHIALAKRHSSKFIFAFDNDEAGFAATLRAMELAYQNDIYPEILSLPQWIKDFDEYINKQFESKQIEIKPENIWNISSMIYDWFDFILDRFLNKFNISNPNWRKDLLSGIFELIINIKDFSIISLFIEKIAKKIGINDTNLLNQFKSFQKDKNRFNSKKIVNKDENDKIYYLWAIFYKDFIAQNSLDIESYKKFIDDNTKIFNNELLMHILENKISLEQKEKLLEIQLWRERQFEWLTNDKKNHIITNYLKKYINDNIKFWMKQTNLTAEQKNDITKKIREMK